MWLKTRLFKINLIITVIMIIFVVKFLHFFKVLDAMSQDKKNYIPDTLSQHQGFLDQNWEALRIS